jgi:hypothetical protein
MTWRSNTASTTDGAWITSKYAGLGVPSAEIPSTGDSGAGYLYNDISAQSAQPTDEMRGQILTWPSAGVFAVNEDSSFLFTGAPDGAYAATYRGYKNGVSYGDYTITLQVGSNAVTSNIIGATPVPIASTNLNLYQTTTVSAGLSTPVALGMVESINNVLLLGGLPTPLASASIQVQFEIIHLTLYGALPVPAALCNIGNILGRVSFSENTVITIPSDDRFIIIEV